MSGDLWTSRLLISQWPNSTGAHRISEATRFSISPASAGTSEASKKGKGASKQLAHFSQAKTRGSSLHGSTPSIETRKEIQDRSAFLRNKTKKETCFAQPWGSRQGKRRRSCCSPDAQDCC